MTSSPTLRFLTPSPTATTTPAHSLPGRPASPGIHAERVQDVAEIEAARADLDFNLAAAGRPAIEWLQDQVVEDAAHGDVERPRLALVSRRRRGRLPADPPARQSLAATKGQLAFIRLRLQVLEQARGTGVRVGAGLEVNAHARQFRMLERGHPRQPPHGGLGRRTELAVSGRLRSAGHEQQWQRSCRAAARESP